MIDRIPDRAIDVLLYYRWVDRYVPRAISARIGTRDWRRRAGRARRFDVIDLVRHLNVNTAVHLPGNIQRQIAHELSRYSKAHLRRVVVLVVGIHIEDDPAWILGCGADAQAVEETFAQRFEWKPLRQTGAPDRSRRL